MGKSIISMAMFNSYVSLPEGKTMPFASSPRKITSAMKKPFPVMDGLLLLGDLKICDNPFNHTVSVYVTLLSKNSSCIQLRSTGKGTQFI